MAITVGTVEIDLRAKMDKLRSDVNEGKNTLSRGVKDMQGVAQAFSGAIAAMGIGAFANYIRGAVDAAGALADLSQKTGVSASVLSGFEYAAKMSGTTIEGIGKGLNKLGVNMYDAASGTGEARNAFKALGISVTDASGKLKGTDKVMGEVADQFKGMSDGAQKSALAVKLFGKSGVELIPLLNEGSDGIEKMRQRAEELGLVISDETATAMESLGDKFDTVGMASTGIARQLGANLTPALTSVADLFLDGTKQGGFLTSAMNLLGDAIRGLISIAYGVSAAFEQVGMSIGALLAASAAALSGNFEGAREILRQNEQDSVASSQRWAGKIADVWSKESKAVTEVDTKTKQLSQTRKADADAAGKQADKIAGVIKKLDDERKMLGMTSIEAEIYKQQTAAGVTANSAAGIKIAEKTRLLDSEKDSHKRGIEAEEAHRKSAEALDAQYSTQIVTVMDLIDKEKQRIATLGKSKSQIEELTLAEMQHRLEMLGAEAEMEAEYNQQIKRIAKQKEYIAILQKGEVADGHIKEAQASGKAWEDVSKDIEKALTDSLMRGFESGKDMVTSLRDYISNAFKSYVIKVLVQPITGAISQLTGGGGGGAGGGGGGGLNSLIGEATGLTAAMTALTSAASAGYALAAGGNAMATFSAGASMVGSATGVTSAAAGVGQMAGAAASGIGSAVTSALAAIPGWGWVALALLTQFEQSKLTKTGTGLEGTLSGSGATGVMATENYDQDHHGLFGIGAYTTKNVERTGAGSQITNVLSDAVRGITAANARYATMLGLDAKALDGFTMALSVNTTGLDAAGVQAAIAAELTKFSLAQLTSAYGEAVSGFAKAGETVADTIQRLIATQQASEVLNQFGGVFSKIAASSMEARDSMIQLAGGIDALIAKSAAFVQSYYSANEQAGIGAKGVLEALNAAGITGAGDLDSKADFRALVESIDVSTQAGREQVNALLDIAPQFAQLATTLEGQDLSLADLAALAPQIAALTPLFTTATDAQATATVTAADATTAAINTTTTAVESGTTAVVGAVSGLSGTITAAVTTSSGLMTSAINLLVARLDALESNGRLQGAAP